MSFSGSVKQELVRQLPSARHCQIAELAALFDLNGRIRRSRDGNEYLEIRTENLTVARKSYMLLNCMFDTSPEVMIVYFIIRWRFVSVVIIFIEISGSIILK